MAQLTKPEYLSKQVDLPIELELARAPIGERLDELVVVLNTRLERALKSGCLPTLEQLCLREPALAHEFRKIYQRLPDHLQLPSRIGGYTVRAFLARTKLSTTLLAQCLRTDRRVIIKLSNDPGSDQLSREHRLATRLNSPFIRRSISQSNEAGREHLVLEYVPGDSLATVLRGRQLTDRAIAKIGLELTAAVDAMHSFGIMHADIKPGNLILRPNGRICLIDLGMSVEYEVDGSDVATNFPAGGTPAYASPELRRGDIDPVFFRQADIYGVGRVLGDMLLGAELTCCRQSDALNGGVHGFEEAMDWQYAPLTRLDRSPVLRDIFVRATKPSPADRFRTAGHMHRAFRFALGSIFLRSSIGCSLA